MAPHITVDADSFVVVGSAGKKSTTKPARLPATAKRAPQSNVVTFVPLRVGVHSANPSSPPYSSTTSRSASRTRNPAPKRPHITPAQYANMANQVGRVKAVLSGDSIVLTSVNNPNAEKIVSLAYVSAPRLNKTGDEPFAFESRDFLRKQLVGKNIEFRVLYEIPTGNQRQYVVALLPDGSRLPQIAVREGWVKLKENAGRKDDSEAAVSLLNELKLLEAQANAEDLGVWSAEDGHIDVQHDLGNTDEFLNQYKGQEIDAIVERVLSGDRLLVRLLTSDKKHYQLMTLVAGIRAPSTERVNPSNNQVQPAEPFGNEAKTFVETRLLQRSVKVKPVGVSPQNQLIAVVKHPKGSIANFLLAAGLARCSDHHSTLLGPEMAELRQAERLAQQERRKLHEGHVAKQASSAATDATVTRVFSADTIFVRNKAGVEKRINISSVRGPRQNEPAEAPWRDAAKEVLRKKIIGKHVRVSIDGARPAADGYDARDVASIFLNDLNVGLFMVEEGYCSVIRHKRDDTDRAPNYDELLAAQENAKENKKGMWSPKAPSIKNYVDASESVQKAKMQLGSLQRQKKIPAVIDFVKSGSRFTVLIPREGVKLNFVLGGIRAPKSARNPNEKSEPFGDEAHELANKRCFQRDCEIDVHNIDKVGGFIGELYINRESFAKTLVEEGLATVHAYSAEQSGNATELFAAEERAKAARKNLWKDYDPSQEAEAQDSSYSSGSYGATANGDAAAAPTERKPDYRDVVVTNIDDDGKLKIQIVGKGTSALESLMSQFRSFHLQPSNNSGLPSDPKTGDFVSAKFSEDGQWYRGRIRSNDRANKVAEVQYIDFGNREKIPWKNLRLLPAQFGVEKLKGQAVDAQLSLLQLPSTTQYMSDAVQFLGELTAGRDLVANVDYTDPSGFLWITLWDAKVGEPRVEESINAEVLAEGLAMVPRKLRPWERAFSTELDKVRELERVAREEERRGMWEYGDLTED